jgi:hypothetical protein
MMKSLKKLLTPAGQKNISPTDRLVYADLYQEGSPAG